MSKGAVIFKPRGILHSMWNPTGQPAMLFETITPAGFEGFFEEIGRLTLASGNVEPAQVDAVAAQFGVRFHWEMMPEILAKVGQRPAMPPSQPEADRSAKRERFPGFE